MVIYGSKNMCHGCGEAGSGFKRYTLHKLGCKIDGYYYFCTECVRIHRSGLYWDKVELAEATHTCNGLILCKKCLKNVREEVML